jgi:uncharacterized protein (DUF2252 family)
MKASVLAEGAALADRQLKLDRERTKRFPDLLTRKLDRMSASPLAFLRGAAPLFYELLTENPELAEGPPGEGWLAGDLHLENFGAYRTQKRNVVFDLNDFDDAIIGPWRLDLLRLTTSLLLGGRELGATGVVALELADRMIGAWCRTVFDGASLPAPPEPVLALVEQERSRSRIALLDARTVLTGGKRRFVRGPRYADLAKDVRAAVPAAFESYLASAPESERPDSSKCSLKILDAALRIAGTGSLGGLRVAVLIEGKGGPNGAWIFDLKEQGTPSAAGLLGAPKVPPAERVVTAFRACVEHTPRVMGTTRLGKIPMVGRRLAPQEDKLDYKRIDAAALPQLATYLGALVGKAHARAARKGVPAPWSVSDRALVRTNAITLAGIHEAAYLALCERIRKLRRAK